MTGFWPKALNALIKKATIRILLILMWIAAVFAFQSLGLNAVKTVIVTSPLCFDPISCHNQLSECIRLPKTVPNALFQLPNAFVVFSGKNYIGFLKTN